MATDGFDLDAILTRVAAETREMLHATTDLDARLEDIMRRNGRDRDGNPLPTTNDTADR